ncbi:MAG: hypothetical protein COA78_32390 [Blastopirellula sp.]|nr:MAG: hypothetical protein COA78_32390 [Blastopirellula sp.]
MDQKKGNLSQVKVPYASIPFDEYYEREEFSTLKRNIGLFWMVLGVYVTYENFNSGSQTPSIWLFLGTAVVAYAYLAKTKYSRIETEVGSILVMKNKDHQRIIDEIEKRRIDFYKREYEDIDFDNHPESEIEKYQWLQKREIISKEAALRKIEIIKFASTGAED